MSYVKAVPAFAELFKTNEGETIVAFNCIDFTDAGNFILKNGVIYMTLEGEQIFKNKMAELLKPVERKMLNIGGKGCTHCIDIMLTYPFKDGRHRMCWILAGYFIAEGYDDNTAYNKLKNWNIEVHNEHLSGQYILSQIKSLRRTKRIPLCNARRNFFKSIGNTDLCPMI